MNSVTLTPAGGRFVAAMQASCGAEKEQILSLLNAKGEITAQTYPRLEKLFDRLERFGRERGICHFGEVELVRYFASHIHAEEILHCANKTEFGKTQGEAAGLVAHVLLPLTEGRYQNGEIDFAVDGFVFNSEGLGTVQCLHSGLIIHLSLDDEVVEGLLREQRESALIGPALCVLSTLITPTRQMEVLKRVSAFFE